MEYLRSSAGYHLDPDEHSLRRQFGVSVNVGVGAGTNAGNGNSKVCKPKKKRKKKASSLQAAQGGINRMKTKNVFAKDYERPRLDVFNEHCDSVVAKYNLDQLHVQGIVTSIEPTEDHVKVVLSLPGVDGIDKHSSNNSDADARSTIKITHTRTRTYLAQNVILALGNDEPSYADWVEEEDIAQGFVRHLLDDDRRSNRTQIQTHCVKDVAVIGGGITAAHKAMELVRNQSPNNVRTYPNKDNSTNTRARSSVHLISCHPIKEQQFDTHQDWMMDQAASKRSEDGGGAGTPDRQKIFKACPCWKERRRTIAQERVPGTITPAIYRGEDGLCYAIENGDVEWHHAEVLKKRYVEKDMVMGMDEELDDNNDDDDGGGGTRTSSPRKRMELSLSCGNTIEVDEVLLATGFGKKLPGGKLIKDMVEISGLEVSNFCGFPIVDENLSWGSSKRIYVAGALAELELGPSARNIAGARLASERILQALAEKV